MNKKPLGRKNYGSIGHLPNSKLGEGDHMVPEGMARIATEKVRDRHDKVIIQEKVDGSNVGVAKVNGTVLAITRAGYLANTSPYKLHHIFAAWVNHPPVYDRFDSILEEKQRLVGEWMIQAHGIQYDLTHEPFIAFDLMKDSERASYKELCDIVDNKFVLPYTISIDRPIPPKEIMSIIANPKVSMRSYMPEGLIYRVERKGKVDFLTKFVRQDFKPGIYFPELTGNPPVLNHFEDPDNIISELIERIGL